MLLNRNLLIIGGLITIAIVICKEVLKLSFCQDSVLLVGNFVLFILTAVAELLLRNGVNSKSNMGFMNAFYGSFMLKFMVVAIGAFTYIYVSEKPNKIALLILFPIYCIYSFVELQSLRTVLKNKKNA